MLTSDLTLTAKYNDEFGEGDDDNVVVAGGRGTDALTSDRSNESEVSDTGSIRQGGVPGSKDTRRAAGSAIITRTKEPNYDEKFTKGRRARELLAIMGCAFTSPVPHQ